MEVVVIPTELAAHGGVKLVAARVVHRFHQTLEEIFLLGPFSHLIIIAKVGFLNGVCNGVFHVAKLVHKAQTEGIGTSPHATLSDTVNVGLAQTTAFGNTLGKVIVSLHHHFLQLGILELRERLSEVSEVGVLVGFGHIEGQTDFVVQEALCIREGAKYANGTRQRGWVGEDVVALGRNPITTRGGVVAHRNDDRLHFLGQIQFATNDGRSHGTAARRIDAQHNGFHVLVLAGLANGLGEVFGIDVSLFVTLAVENLSRGINDGHFVPALALEVVRLGIVGIRNGVDALVAARQAFQLVKHLVLVVQVVDQTVFQCLFGVEHGLQVVGNLVQLLHADVAALADAREDLAPNSAQQFLHLLTVGLTHLIQEIRLHGTLELVVRAAHNLHLDIKLVQKVLVEHDL